MTATQNALMLVARLLIAPMFLLAGIGKVTDFQGTVGYIGSVALPMPQLLAAAALVLEIVASVLLIIGWKTRWAALALALFTLATALFFHNFWAMPADEQMMQQIIFLKNLAVAGGLLMATAVGPGGWSLDLR
jgi:putative oxidoreductase